MNVRRRMGEGAISIRFRRAVRYTMGKEENRGLSSLMQVINLGVGLTSMIGSDDW